LRRGRLDTTLKGSLRLWDADFKDGLKVLVSPAPGITFTTGLAGNLNPSGGDPAKAAANRTAVSEALGIARGWMTARQVHGREVLFADRARPERAGAPQADAIVVRQPGRPVAVLVADCVPIALSGPGVAAAVHAGWRGLCAGVIEAAVAGAGPSAGLSAWIGPCIGACCFEVGAEVPEQFAASHPFAPDCCESVGGRLHFDLRKAAAAVLETSGAKVAGGLDAPCTCCDRRFFSHRRDRTPQRQALVTWVGAGR
jgi:purine-nucleoside/S-methyl-5'-thioadenosine phosphorylase / adenosine deaminase